MRKIIIFIILQLFVHANQYAQTQKPLKGKSFLIPAVLVIYGLSTYHNNGFPSSYQVKTYRDLNYKNFNSPIDDVLPFVPILFNYGLSYSGVKSHSDFTNRSIIYVKAGVISLVSVSLIKYGSRVLRPDSTAFNSFPSGHTAFAFAMATVMDHELREQSTLYSVLGYGCASGVAAMRILNNRHWFSDVLAGAGMGIASGHIASHTHTYKWGNFWKGTLISPILYSNTYGFVVNKKF